MTRACNCEVEVTRNGEGRSHPGCQFRRNNLNLNRKSNVAVGSLSLGDGEHLSGQKEVCLQTSFLK